MAGRGGAARRAVAAVVRTRPGRGAVVAAWAARSRVPWRVHRLLDDALALGEALARAGDPDAARAVYDITGGRLDVPDARARLAGAAALRTVEAGGVPEHLDPVLRGLLDLADAAFDRSDDATCATRMSEALALAFHPNLQLRTERPLLAEDPTAYLGPFRTSRAFTAMTRTPPRARTAVPRPPRPVRLLFVTFRNMNFLRDIIEEYAADPRVEVRTLDLAEVDGVTTDLPGLVRARLRHARTGSPVEVPDAAREPLEWADRVFVEWGSRQLVWASLAVAPGTPLVARIHSYEISTPMPQLVSWTAVDDVVFVAPPIRALAIAVVPGLVDGPRLHTVRNRNGIEAFARPKVAGAPRTVALVGWAGENKDPAWALDVLDHLLAEDPTWRLLLVGDPPGRPRSPREAEYQRRVRARLDALGAAVELVPFTRDVPGVLRRAGVILSASRREGTHEAVAEGAASGALPVVRDWPVVARWGGARAVYPEDWVVTTPLEAARRILRAAASEHGPAEAVTAQRWALENLSWHAVRPRFDAIVLGTA